MYQKKHYSDFIEKLLSYLETHMSNPDLTLKWIFRKLPVYERKLCKSLFLKRNRAKIFHLSYESRVQKAKEIFESNNAEKIQNVAELVGIWQ